MLRALVAVFAAGALLSSVAAHDHTSSLEHRLRSRATTTTPTCKNGFTIDSTRTKCICRPGKVTNVGKTKCLDSCSSGSYPVGDGTCAACPAPFAKCSSRTVPTGCVNGYFLSAGACVKTCPLGTWGDSAPTKNRCRPCADKDAVSCSDRGATATACSNGYLLDGKCLTLSQVPDGYYADSTTHIAKACEANVKTCKCRGPGCALTCGKSKKGDQYLLTPKGTCEMHCPSNSYGSKKLGLCLPCDSTELTCDAGGAITCAKDSAGTQLLLTPTRKCVLPWKGPTGYYADMDSATFKKCGDGVTACTGPNQCEALACDADSDGNPLFFSLCGQQKRSLRSNEVQTGACVTNQYCNVRYWPDLSTHTCQPCDANEDACTGSGEGQATACAYRFYLTTAGDCVTAQNCLDVGAFYPMGSRPGICRACDPGVATCTGNGEGTATSCSKDTDGKQLYLNNGDCLSSAACPVGTYADDDSKTCSSCIDLFGNSDVARCTAEKVMGCMSGVIFNNGCIPECPASVALMVGPECILCNDLYPGSSTCTGMGPASCARAEDGATLYVDGRRCVTADECPSDQYGSDDAGACVPCTAFGVLTETCDLQGAMSCTGSAILYEKGCFESCPAGTYPDGGSCSSCDNVATGDDCDLSKAQSCGYLLDERLGSCTASCPPNSNGVDTPAGYVDGSVCKSCGGVEVDTCDATGALTCRAPYARLGNDCISADACLALGATIYPGYVPSGRGYDVGYCWHCDGVVVEDEQGRSCGN